MRLPVDQRYTDQDIDETIAAVHKVITDSGVSEETVAGLQARGGTEMLAALTNKKFTAKQVELAIEAAAPTPVKPDHGHVPHV